MSELIDREAAIRKIEPWLYSEGRGESEINMLRAVIDTLKNMTAAPRWHRVEDELPKEKNWVLVWHTGYATPKKAKFIVDVIPEFLLDGGGGAWELDGWSDNKGKVTHWMPLPEPPKEEA